MVRSHGDISSQRLADLESRLIKRFCEFGGGNPEAFKDADFQYVLTRAQHAYVRSGDEGVRDILVDLITSRSKETIRGRLSLTLNDAVEKAAVLTKNEFAELSLCYLIRYTILSGIGNLERFWERFSQLVSPLLPDIAPRNASYQYIEAQSCGTIGALEFNLINQLRRKYTGVFSSGFAEAQLAQVLSEERMASLRGGTLIIQCLNDATKLQFNRLNEKEFKEAAAELGLSEKEINDAWNVFEATVWNGEDFLENVQKHFPDIRTLHKLWEGRP